MGKQQKITMTDEEWAIVDSVARTLGTSDSDVVSLGFRLGLPRLQEIHESAQQIKRSETLRSLLTRLSNGETVVDHELITISGDTEVPIAILHKIRDCFSSKGGRGQDATIPDRV